MPGQQFEYAFDDIGNRTSTKAGVTWGANVYKVDHGYLANSVLIETTNFKQGTSMTRLTTGRTYDWANRLTRILLDPKRRRANSV